MSQFRLSNKSKKNRIGVDERLIEMDDLAITLTKVDYGHGPDAGVREDERQMELFKLGVSKADGVKKRSNHQRSKKDGKGKALDCTAYVDGKPSYDHAAYAMIALAWMQAAMMLGYKLRVGIMFSTGPTINGIRYGWDGPHMEIIEE